MTWPTVILIALLVLWFIKLPWSLWVAYVAIMRLKQVREAGQLTTAMKVFGYPLLFRGLVLDFFCNLITASLLFREWPREWTVSSRLWRLSQTGTGWRQQRAIAMRIALLDAIDPSGLHKG